MSLIAMGIGAAVSMVGSLFGQKSQNELYAAQETARRKQLLQAVRQANTQDANLQLQDRSNFEAARLELENQTMSHIKASSTVQTAMAESSLEGRSMKRVKADVDNAYLRTKGMINENYTRNYHNIYVQRQGVRDNLIAQVEGSQPQQRASGISNVIDTATAGAQGVTMGSNLWGVLSQVK